LSQTWRSPASNVNNETAGYQLWNGHAGRRVGRRTAAFRYNLQQTGRCGVMRASRGNHEA